MTADRGARRTDRAPRVLLVTHSYRPDRTPPARRWAAVVAALQASGYDAQVAGHLTAEPGVTLRVGALELKYA